MSRLSRANHRRTLRQEIRIGDEAGCWWRRNDREIVEDAAPDATTRREFTPNAEIGKKADESMKSQKSSIKWRVNTPVARVLVTTGTVTAAALAMAAPFRWYAMFSW